MPVQWRPYQSMYVSQRSPEIAQILRQRFANNFAAQDEVKQKLLELQAAPFDGDQAAKNALDASIQQRLNMFSERGDYENMTMDVARLARDYQNQAYPLMRNQQLYAQDVQEKSDMLQKGVITADMYNNWLKSTKYRFDTTENTYKPYTGVQLGPDGKPDPTSYYQPTQVAAFVDVQGEILKQLNQLDQVKSGGHTVSMYKTKDDGIEYYIEDRGSIIEQVPEELVRQVTEGVLRRSDVQSYMQQDARFKTIGVDDRVINQTIQDRINLLRSAGSPEATGRAIELEKVLMSGTPGQRRQAAERSLYDTEYQRLHSMGLNARTPSVYGSLHTEEYSKKYLAGLANTPEIDTPPDDSLLFQGTPDSFYSPLVDPGTRTATTESITNGIRSAQATQALAVQTLQETIPGIAGLPSNDLLEILRTISQTDLIEYVKNDGMSQNDYQLLEQARVNIQNQERIIEVANRTREMVYGESGFNAIETANYVSQEVATEMDISTVDLPTTVSSMLDGTSPELVARNIIQRTFHDGAAPGGDRVQAAVALIEEVLGFSQEEAERIAIETFSEPLTEKVMSHYVGSSYGDDPGIIRRNSAAGPARPVYINVPRAVLVNNDLNSFAEDVARTYRSTARERYESYREQLNAALQGSAEFDRVEFLPNSDKDKLARQVREYFVGGDGKRALSLSDMKGIAGLNGKAVDRIIADQLGLDYDSPVLNNMEVDNVYFTRGYRRDGAVVPMLEFKFTAPKNDDIDIASDSESIKVPLESMMSFDQGLGQAINGEFDTPADKVINEIFTQFYYAPGLVTRYGAKHTYQDRKGNYFEFTFVPEYGQNNVITGFKQIEFVGYSVRQGTVRGLFNNEAEFIESFNNIVEG